MPSSVRHFSVRHIGGCFSFHFRVCYALGRRRFALLRYDCFSFIIVIIILLIRLPPHALHLHIYYTGAESKISSSINWRWDVIGLGSIRADTNLEFCFLYVACCCCCCCWCWCFCIVFAARSLITCILPIHLGFCSTNTNEVKRKNEIYIWEEEEKKDPHATIYPRISLALNNFISLYRFSFWFWIKL